MPYGLVKFTDVKRNSQHQYRKNNEVEIRTTKVVNNIHQTVSIDLSLHFKHEVHILLYWGYVNILNNKY